MTVIISTIQLVLWCLDYERGKVHVMDADLDTKLMNMNDLQSRFKR